MESIWLLNATNSCRYSNVHNRWIDIYYLLFIYFYREIAQHLSFSCLTTNLIDLYLFIWSVLTHYFLLSQIFSSPMFISGKIFLSLGKNICEAGHGVLTAPASDTDWAAERSWRPISCWCRHNRFCFGGQSPGRARTGDTPSPPSTHSRGHGGSVPRPRGQCRWNKLWQMVLRLIVIDCLRLLFIGMWVCHVSDIPSSKLSKI